MHCRAEFLRVPEALDKTKSAADSRLCVWSLPRRVHPAECRNALCSVTSF